MHICGPGSTGVAGEYDDRKRCLVGQAVSCSGRAVEALKIAGFPHPHHVGYRILWLLLMF